jgi:hypothetical protein
VTRGDAGSGDMLSLFSVASSSVRTLGDSWLSPLGDPGGGAIDGVATGHRDL